MVNTDMLLNDNFKVLDYLFQNKLTEIENNNGDIEYLFFTTQRDLVNKLNLSLPTINKIIKQLDEARLISPKKNQKGVYCTNPEAIFIYSQIKQLISRNN